MIESSVMGEVTQYSTNNRKIAFHEVYDDFRTKNPGQMRNKTLGVKSRFSGKNSTFSPS
jgi:hypothetical protein